MRTKIPLSSFYKRILGCQRTPWLRRATQATLVLILSGVCGCVTSPVHMAAASGDQEQVKRLLQQGANINTQFYDQGTPLHQAIMANHLDLAEFLIEGADVNATALKGTTPLYEASYRGLTPAAKLLLKHGSNPNIANVNGFTPLMAAAETGHEEIVAILLRSGADAKAKNDQGKSAFSIALFAGQKNIVNLLDPDFAKQFQPNITQRGGAYAGKRMVIMDKDMNILYP